MELWKNRFDIAQTWLRSLSDEIGHGRVICFPLSDWEAILDFLAP